MFSLPGAFALLLLTYIRPQEVWPLLGKVPLFDVSFALALLGLALDIRLRLVRPQASPQLYWALGFLGWCLVTGVLFRGDELPTVALQLAMIFAFYLVVAAGTQSFRGLSLLAGSTLALTLFLTGIGLHQRAAPLGCLEVDVSSGNELLGTPDGRSCRERVDCYRGDHEPGAEYACERFGLLGTSTVLGRVRYRGKLQDPNELALVISIAVPLLITLFRRRDGRPRWMIWSLLIPAMLLCVIFTQSRGGQLVFLAVLGVYFVHRFRLAGAMAGALMSIPLLLYVAAGRSDAAASSTERLECWYEGMSMFRSSPVLGVGYGMFERYHYMTAHNAYVLVAAELGAVGTALWVGLLYVTVKILVVALRRYDPQGDGGVAYRWALALAASMAGLLVGIFFLSFAYHYILWIYVGLCGAFESAVRTHDPQWRLRFGWRDLTLVGAGSFALIIGLYVLTRLNPP